MEINMLKEYTTFEEMSVKAQHTLALIEQHITGWAHYLYVLISCSEKQRLYILWS